MALRCGGGRDSDLTGGLPPAPNPPPHTPGNERQTLSSLLWNTEGLCGPEMVTTRVLQFSRVDSQVFELKSKSSLKSLVQVQVKSQAFELNSKLSLKTLVTSH